MKTLYKVDEVKELIRQGKTLMLAGDERLLSGLPKGHWIGGTIPYFMSERGGLKTHEEIQVMQLPDYVSNIRIKSYQEKDLPGLPADYDENGVSLIVMPAFTPLHRTYARDCSSYKGLFDRPLVGWVTGFDLDGDEKTSAKVVDGATGEIFDDRAVAMHVHLPNDKYGKVNIVNLFRQGAGDTISFPVLGFEVGDCFVNGKPDNLVDYLRRNKIDTQLPLVADYMGAMVNAAIQNVDEASRKVTLFAPVFPGVEYKLALPVEDYEARFLHEMPPESMRPVFSCNCVLNYLYAHLEGRTTGKVFGPMTFGEIAYMLLTQTMVYLTFEDKK